MAQKFSSVPVVWMSVIETGELLCWVHQSVAQSNVAPVTNTRQILASMFYSDVGTLIVLN